MSTRRYFDRHARTLDRRYDGRWPFTTLRRGPELGRELAVSVVARHAARHTGPAVLDVGCGPGRVAEAVLDAGAATYTGIDLSPRMLALAGRRLAGHASVELVEGDFRDLYLSRTFDIVLSLGVFDYLEDPERAARWLLDHCSSELVASFPKWDWLKGPVRHLHYELVHRCPLFDYDETRVQALLRGAGFSSVELRWTGRRGFLVCATP